MCACFFAGLRQVAELLRIDDVAAGLEQQPGDGVDDARRVATRQREDELLRVGHAASADCTEPRPAPTRSRRRRLDSPRPAAGDRSPARPARARASSVRQRVWPKRQTRSKQGAQSSRSSSFSHSTRARGFSGGVCSGLVEPNTAACGTPNAAATCIRPESLLTTPRAAAISAIASISEVCPASTRQRRPACCAISSHSAASLAEPSSSTGRPLRRAAPRRAPRSAPPASTWPGRIRRPARTPSRRPARRRRASPRPRAWRRRSAAAAALAARRAGAGQRAVEGHHRRPTRRHLRRLPVEQPQRPSPGSRRAAGCARARAAAPT